MKTVSLGSGNALNLECVNIPIQLTAGCFSESPKNYLVINLHNHFPVLFNSVVNIFIYEEVKFSLAYFGINEFFTVTKCKLSILHIANKLREKYGFHHQVAHVLSHMPFNFMSFVFRSDHYYY